MLFREIIEKANKLEEEINSLEHALLVLTGIPKSQFNNAKTETLMRFKKDERYSIQVLLKELLKSEKELENLKNTEI